MKHEELRAAIVRTAQEMTRVGINQGTAGNISARIDDGLLITPSSLPYDRMLPEDIVEMKFDGSWEGRRPSSEWRFHRDILADRPDANVVLHCHSIYAATLACKFMDIPAFHYMVGIAGGPDIRCSDYATYGTQALSDTAIIALKDRMACLLGQHGQIALGKDLDAALAMAIEVETTSQMYYQVLTLGEPNIIDDAEMARVIEQMRRMSYGQAPND